MVIKRGSPCMYTYNVEYPCGWFIWSFNLNMWHIKPYCEAWQGFKGAGTWGADGIPVCWPV